ncbi:MAG TPA: shikimate dehydrogenase [Chthonomonadales bacterium]|nr:shikimate dehydrogenase [Chthonomonadales bacterium]
MERFAFIIHPIDARRDVARKYPVARYLPVPCIEWFLKRHRPLCVAHVTGVRSVVGPEAEGWFIGCPLTPRQFLSLPVEDVYAKLVECGRIAEDLGARIIGLGAFTSVVGDGGATVASRLRIPVTTGNSYTVATAVQGAVRGADLMGVHLPQAMAAIVGATGSIGATCAVMLGRLVGHLVLVGRDRVRLEALADRIRPSLSTPTSVATDIADGLRNADVVITVSSATEAIVLPQHVKRGAVVCDVARPRDVSIAVARERDDVLVIEGGLVRVPGAMQCTSASSGKPFSFGFPPGTAYACMSETMALALEGRYESFTLGKDVSVEQADELARLCDKHGFALDGFRSFERALSYDEVAAIRQRAGRPAS